MREAFLPHTDQMARSVIAYGQFDKISTAWELSLPGPTTGLTSPVFTEVVAMHLLLPSIVCSEVVGMQFGNKIKYAQKGVSEKHFFKKIKSTTQYALAWGLV